jgi:3-methyladenine DNA glycosylase/8-oxoguanine DNA glycosylase
VSFTHLFDLPLVGPGGEPIDLHRTILSHGVASLPPARIDEEAGVMTVAVALAPERIGVVRVAAGPPGHAAISIAGSMPDDADRDGVERAVRHLLRFDADLSGFYRTLRDDPDLAWAATGAGRMIRSATVFEDVVKTICTTNCTWSATERMVGALVNHLGADADGLAGDLPTRVFPTPRAMAEAPESFYRDVAKAGYRGRYLRQLAASMVAGEVDLEALATTDLPTPEVERLLRALPGVGPYAAAHILTLLGRYDRLIFDSWTRPTYRRLSGDDEATDRDIEARFAPYGLWAGLAFWLYLTRRWIPDREQEPPGQSVEQDPGVASVPPGVFGAGLTQ